MAKTQTLNIHTVERVKRKIEYKDFLGCVSVFTGMKYSSYCVANTFLVINKDKLLEMIKLYKINWGNYNSGNNNTSNKEEMWISSREEFPSPCFLLSLSTPLLFKSALHSLSFPSYPCLIWRVIRVTRGCIEEEEDEDTCSTGGVLGVSEESPWSGLLGAHVVIVRQRPGCVASSRQAVIGWNVHE